MPKLDIKTDFTKKDLRLISKYKDDYKVEKVTYLNKRVKIELWRKHHNGYYNFVCYLNNADEIEVNNAILTDIKKLKSKS